MRLGAAQRCACGAPLCVRRVGGAHADRHRRAGARLCVRSAVVMGLTNGMQLRIHAVGAGHVPLMRGDGTYVCSRCGVGARWDKAARRFAGTMASARTQCFP